MYNDVYSALYEWNLKRWSGDAYMASWMTAAGLAGAVGMNIVLATGVVATLYGADTLAEILPLSVVHLVIGLILIGHYFAFVWQDRCEQVLLRFRANSCRVQRRVRVLAWAYVLASYGLPIGFFYLTAKGTH